MVVVWAPGVRVAPIDEAARRAGAAVIDRSPSATTLPATASIIKRGIEAYDALRYDDAWATLDEARALTDRTGAAGLTQSQLADLFLYRGLIKTQQGDTNSAWEELVVANTVDPLRELDPGRFPPKIIAEFERAQATVKNKGTAELTLTVPTGCRVSVDATNVNVASPIQLIVGRHWVRVTCADREPDGRKIELVGGKITLPLQPPQLAPPSDTDLLVQARTMGARAFVVAEVRSNVATARLVGLDGRERDRKTVTIGNDLSPLADAVTALLTPPKHTPWYRTKWAWAGGGAIAAAAILIPLTILATQASDPQSTTHMPAFPDGYSPL